MDTPYSQRIAAIQAAMSPFMRFYTEAPWLQRADDPRVNNFVFGNPHEMPLHSFVTTLQHWSVPQNKDWFAYKNNEPAAQAFVATMLRERHRLPFEADDIFLTNGGFAALAVTLTAIIDPGDEVIFISPPWFFYEALITASGGVPVPVAMSRTTFDLDLAGIEAAITERTRAIIINSPHNPTGKIYAAVTLQRLGHLLSAASARNDRTISLLSDEAYSRIVFDDQTFTSPTAFYPASFLLYTYGKTLLTPGQRIGYIALAPTMPNREALRGALFTAQITNGWAFPNALLQHALPDLERLSIDIAHLQQKRDRMVTALRAVGYELHAPEGTFYMLVRSPLDDDRAFVDLLAEYDIFCLPRVVVNLPGYFRISLTASDVMIERALPGFAAAFQEARRRSGSVTLPLAV